MRTLTSYMYRLNMTYRLTGGRAYWSILGSTNWSHRSVRLDVSLEIIEDGLPTLLLHLGGILGFRVEHGGHLGGGAHALEAGDRPAPVEQ